MCVKTTSFMQWARSVFVGRKSTGRLIRAILDELVELWAIVNGLRT